MNKNVIRERWRDSEFLASVDSILLGIASGNASLANIDIGGIAIGTNEAIRNLANANLYKAKLSNVDMSFAVLACSLNETELDHVIFCGATFDRCLIKKSKITTCAFTDAKLIVNFDDSILRNCNFAGAVFAGGKAGAEYGGRRVKFFDCDFRGTVFRHVEFRASDFVGCAFDGAQFDGCDLRGAKASGGSIPVASQFRKMEIPSWVLAE